MPRMITIEKVTWTIDNAMHSVVWYSLVVVAFLQETYVVGSTQWPSEQCALLKPETGCPSNWKDKAWIFQDTKLKKTGNERSRILHIDGHVSRYYVVRSFCIKTGMDAGSLNWPQGHYCIYRNKRFSTGSIKVTGDHDNKDAVKYTGSFVEYHDDTNRHIKFYFYCQASGNKKIPISIPITKPFYLLPYGSRDCQQVQWMVATSEWIKYQTDNIINGTVPHYKLESTQGMTMFYCYYQSCNSTLNDISGVFQSPGFPGQYPDGQLCSWRIVVPDNHTLRVRFTNFSLSANDTLRYSKSINGSFKLWYTIPYFIEPPITVSYNSNVLFVFRSDESNNSTGFKADYSVFPQLKAKPTATHSGPAATLPSETSSMPLTTPRSESNEETIIKTSTASKKEDTQATTQTSNSKSTVRIKTKAVTTNQQQLTTVHESSTPSNCTSDDRGKEALTNSRQWNGKLIVIVIPLACFLVIVFLIVDIVYRYRSKRKNLRKTASEIRSVDQLPMAVNPTYDSGAILLNQPNDTTIPTTIMRINENDLNTNQPLTDRPPDYEDVENWKPSKTAPKKDHTIPGCNGSNACSETTTEETTKISENPFYESAMTSPPFVEANKLYESVKMDQGKTEK